MNEARDALSGELLAFMRQAGTQAVPVPIPDLAGNASSQERVAHEALLKEQQIHTILTRQGASSQADRDLLLASINECLKREGLA